MSKIIKFFVMPMLFLSCVNAAYAYTLNKNVSGYVTDVFTNKPVSGVRVVYHPLSSVSHDFSAVTNSAGYYSIQNLPWYDVTGMANRIGYTISVSASGYLNFTSPTVYFNDKNAYNIQLFPASASAEISGVVKDQAGTALPVITLTLKPNGYGYGTHDYTAVSDASGRYDITGIIRYVYSSGPAPKWVIYKMYISQAGYYDYVSEDISFQNVTNVIKNITISSRASEKIKTTVDNIAYRYRPLDGEPFFVREVATCKFIKTQAGKADEVTEVSLNPGERIVDRIFQALPYEGSFIFYRSDRSLSALFKAITQSNPEFDASGKLANMVISGTDHTDHPSILTRSNLTYDNLGRLIGYSAMIKTPAPNSTPTFPIYQIDDLIAKSIEYDAAGKIQTIIYIPHFHGPAETWKLSDIVYDADGDLIVWIQQKL